jgi:FkbM family methyltransferase
MNAAAPRTRRAALLRRLAESAPLAPLGARLACARTVREPFAFALNEVKRPADVRSYRLRESGLVVVLRHAAQDSATLAEVFYRHDYTPPPAVTAALGEPDSIVDLGANIGLFGLFAAAHWPSAGLRAYEADPANAAVHAQAIAANGLGGRWHLTAAAAGAHRGDVEFAAGRAMASYVIDAGVEPGVPTLHVPMVDVMDEVAAADLVKVDIEGGEWEILQDQRFRASPPRVIVLEYHPHLCPTSDPRGQAEALVRQAGLTIEPIWHRDDGYGMFWAWRA